MSELILFINDKKVKASPGTTILKAAQEAGIYIPALCSHPLLPSLGRCRLCAVEIEGEIHLACQTQASDGLVIKTDSEAVQRYRKEGLKELLWLHPHACLECWRRERCRPGQICLRTRSIFEHCLICPKNYHCEFQNTCDYVGVERDIPYRGGIYDIIRDNPYFVRDPNLCILCGRCISICRDVRGVGVYQFDDEKTPSKVFAVNNNKVLDSGCKSCFGCVEVCPTATLVDKELKKLRQQKETYIVPCADACPAYIDIPRYLYFVSQEKFSEALAVIREKVPFPAVLGRACFAPCEKACRRDKLTQPLAIRVSKRAAADYGDDSLWKKNLKLRPPSGKKVAIIGAGPAGLAAAYYLSIQGHSVTVFDALPQPGGMMRSCIPEYRLPRNILDYEISLIQEVGVEIRCGTKIEEIALLFEQGYQAVLIAIGTHKGIKLGVPGEELDGVMDVIEFLRRVNLREGVTVGRKVAVIGGGNAAIDGARVALRLGAEEVVIAYRRRREDMPATPEETEAALEEGVKIMPLSAPNKIFFDSRLKLECLRMGLGPPDASGRPRPIPIKGSEFIVEVDNIIVAIGQLPDIPPKFNIRTGKGDVILIDPKTGQTNKPGVFACGDVVSGPSSIIEAISSGRQASSFIDQFLGGDGDIDQKLVFEETSDWLGKEEGFAFREREKMPHISLARRLSGFDEVETGFSPDVAIREASRCLRCDLRLRIPSPVLPLRR